MAATIFNFLNRERRTSVRSHDFPRTYRLPAGSGSVAALRQSVTALGSQQPLSLLQLDLGDPPRYHAMHRVALGTEQTSSGRTQVERRHAVGLVLLLKCRHVLHPKVLAFSATAIPQLGLDIIGRFGDLAARGAFRVA